ncbi:TonB-dependent receptor [Parahaliea mediterranea]|uniref:TonB-dependent receptor n=1 Tax=Parahaliea mediterranea TaxID=651086 RepID=A0A939DEN0_9GAMM|nr:TonB-dependent receptor [Parahaliea mediterranea]MBN7796496.1 TonB-dependent receptor [Parahaliea mediterranea]
MQQPASSLALAALALAVPAAGQAQSPAGTVMLEEVVVTAQRRDQSLQDVPLSVSAFSADQLQQAGTTTIVDLQQAAPNVTLAPSRGTNSTLTAFIRGVGQQDPLWGFEPGVGLYLDDVYIARPQGAVLDVYDVERVEILRGPQGTLYGKNTIGGAVKYVTRRLDEATALDVSARVGSYNQRDLTVSGSTALADGLYLGGALASFKRDGYGELLSFDAPNYDKEILSGRLSLEWHATDALYLRLQYDRSNDKSNAKGGHRLTVGAIGGAPVLDDVFDSRAGLDPDTEVNTEGAALTVEYSPADRWTLKSITAYRDGDSVGPIDFDNLEVNDFDVPASVSDHQFSQEIQWLYDSDNWHMVSGLYYFSGSSGGRFDAILGQTVPGALIGLPIPWIPLIQTTYGEADTESYSAFVDVDYSFNEQWSLNIGGRYTEDTKDATVFSEQFGNLSGDPQDPFRIPVAVLSDYSNSKTFSEFSPRITARFAPTEQLMFYAGYSEGFKSGGFDMRGNQAANPQTVEGFDPETVDSLEIGAKGEFFDHRLRLNLSAFHANYKDMQVVTAVGFASNALGFPVPVQNVENVGEATLQGAELEAEAQLPMNLRLAANIGYIDTTIDEWLTADPANPGGFIDVSSQRDIQNTPRWTGQVALASDMDLGSRGALTGSLSVAYRSAVQMFETPSAIDEDSYTLWNASLLWYSPGDHWTVGLHGKNLGDREYRVAGYNFPTTGEGEVIGYYGAPRTVSLQVDYRF